MRGHKDLRLIVAAAALLAALALVVPVDPLRLVLVAPLALFLPGYALSAAIFARQEIPLRHFIVLSAGLSLAVLALGALPLNYLPGGVRSGWWALLLVLVVLAACRAAALRRPRAGGGPLSVPRPRLHLAQAGLLAGGAVAIVAAIVLAYTPLSASKAVGYTALWIQPLRGESAGVRVGVESAEPEEATYRLFVQFGGGLPVQGRGFRLAPGEEKVVRLPAEGEVRGVVPVRAALFREDHPHRAYRRVSTWIEPLTGKG
jgi:Protein of unknown function (DUF1616)